MLNKRPGKEMHSERMNLRNPFQSEAEIRRARLSRALVAYRCVWVKAALGRRKGKEVGITCLNLNLLLARMTIRIT
eukprot:scaffold9695_cov181-Amphora_coffeaeformis.AAC.8